MGIFYIKGIIEDVEVGTGNVVNTLVLTKPLPDITLMSCV
jgi:hypothetical protein